MKRTRNFLCFICKKPTTDVCGICKMAAYCSKSCQKKDWLAHKLLCTSTGKKARKSLSFEMDDDLVHSGILDMFRALGIRHESEKKIEPRINCLFATQLSTSVKERYKESFSTIIEQNEHIYQIATYYIDVIPRGWSCDELWLCYPTQPLEEWRATVLVSAPSVYFKDILEHITCDDAILTAIGFFDLSVCINERTLLYRPKTDEFKHSRSNICNGECKVVHDD